jgi:hypothetical protein
MEDTMTETLSTRPTRGSLPTYHVMLGVVFAICTVGMSLNLLAAIATDVVDEGPRTLQEQLVGVIGFGLAALAISAAGAWWFSSSASRSKVGAILFGILCVPTLVLFFSGAPGMFGATAAFLAGLTRGRTPSSGAPRLFGIVGLVIAILNVAVTILGIGVAWLADGG